MAQRNNSTFILILAVLFWSGAIWSVILLRPAGWSAIAFFLSLLFVALFFTNIVLIGNIRRALIIASGITLYLVLRLFSLDSVLNILLFAGFLLMVELYFSKPEEK